MYKALIVDDELVAINVLTLMIKRHLPQITLIEQAHSAAEGLQLIEEFNPDIVFLDIEMPYHNGFELLRSLNEINFDIIFTTAYDKYAILAIKFSALDYLMKPIDADELKESFERFLQKRNLQENQKAPIENLLSNLEQKNISKHRLALPTRKGTQFFLPKEIIRCEGLSNYTRFHFANKQTITAARTIKEYEEILLPHKFVRTHKSHLVNPAFVSGYDAQSLHLLLTDGSLIDISRRRKKEVLEELGLQK